MNVHISRKRNKVIYTITGLGLNCMEVRALPDGIIIEDVPSKRAVAVLPEEIDSLISVLQQAKISMVKLQGEQP